MRKQPLHPTRPGAPRSLEVSLIKAGRTFIINHSIPAEGANPGTGPPEQSTQQTDVQRR